MRSSPDKKELSVRSCGQLTRLKICMEPPACPAPFDRQLEGARVIVKLNDIRRDMPIH